MRPQLPVASADDHPAELCLNPERSHTRKGPIAKLEHRAGCPALACAICRDLSEGRLEATSSLQTVDTNLYLSPPSPLKNRRIGSSFSQSNPTPEHLRNNHICVPDASDRTSPPSGSTIRTRGGFIPLRGIRQMLHGGQTEMPHVRGFLALVTFPVLLSMSV